MRVRSFCCASAYSFLLLICLVSSLQAQDTGASHETAASLVSSAQAALAGSASVADLVLTGTANLPKGKELASGSVTLKVKGTRYARLDISAGPDSRSEVRTGVLGEWIGGDGNAHRTASHNSLGPAAWFSPLAVVTAMMEPSAVVTYIGREKRNQIEVEHLRYRRTFPKRPSALSAEVQRRVPDFSKFSTVDVFLRADSYLPIALEFNLHPDNNTRLNIPAEVRYADYRVVNGIRMPFRVQRLVMNTLDLDVSLESASVNAGVADSEFALRSQAAPVPERLQ